MKLTRKQDLTREAWQTASQHIEAIRPHKPFMTFVNDTLDRIKTTSAGKRVAYAWSGGKDSIALQWLMQEAGITNSMIALTNLEYPDFEAWIRDHQPDNLTIHRTEHDWNWLSQNPARIFPQNSKDAAIWYRTVQHKEQADYYRTQNLDAIILGRRTQDGNYVGRGGSNTYTNKQGITRWSPIAHWKHEDIIALITYKNLSLPPIYDYPRGYIVGTTPWPARTGTNPDPNHPHYGWHETHQISPELVQTAAKYGLPGARNYLNRRTTK